MDYGAHLPVVDFGSHQFSLERLSAYVQTARDLGFKALSPYDERPFDIVAPMARRADGTCGNAFSQRRHGGRDERPAAGGSRSVANGKGPGRHRSALQWAAIRRRRPGFVGARL